MYWGKKPIGFSIDTDFILGSLEKPTHWLLATSTRSAKNSPEKFWRNVAELFEAKRTFVPRPCVIDLVFESEQMQRLQKAMSALSDGNLYFPEYGFGNELIGLVNKFVTRLPKEKIAKAKYLEEKITKSADAKEAYGQFVEQLSKTLESHKPELDSLWEKLSKSAARKIEYRESRLTFLRRGAAKLLLMPDSFREQVIHSVETGERLNRVPRFARELGFARRWLEEVALQTAS